MVMSELYSIQDTTLTALGDAIRVHKPLRDGKTNISTIGIQKTKNANGIDDYTKISLDDSEKYSCSTMASVRAYDDVAKIKVKLAYITDKDTPNTRYRMRVFNQYFPMGAAFTYSNTNYLYEFEVAETETIIKEFEIEGNELTLVLCPTYFGATSIDRNMYFYAEIEFLDSNGNHLDYYEPIQVKNTMTPLEMVDAINGLNTESGKKLPWIVQRTDVPNFTITAEDIAGVSKIGVNAFYNNTTLTAIELPDTVQEFLDSSLYATGITEITLPVALSRIRNSVFSYCRELTTVRILNDTSVITCPKEDYADPFSGCSKLTSIYIPSKLYNAYCADVYWGKHKNKFIVVGEWAFDPKVNPTLLFNQSVEVSIQLQDFANTPEFSITSSNEEVATISNVSINEDNTLLTYTINSLAVEGSSTITVNIVGEKNTFNFTNNVRVFETIPEPTYEIIPQVEGATYGFALREDGYWESQNFKKSDSASVCQVNISNMKGVPVYFDCINYAEANYDYGLLGAVNQVLGKTNSDDSGVKKNFKGLSKADIQTVEYTDATGDCFIQVKFKKDSSGDQNNDSVRFKVRFGE